jgi:hypothetical protein
MRLIIIDEAAAAFDPTTFFAGTTGGYYDLTLASSLWADSARTTPASVGGQVLGVTDLSGNGYHLSGTDTGMLRRETGGINRVEFPGKADDFSTYTGLIVNGTATMGSTASVSAMCLYKTSTLSPSASAQSLISSDQKFAPGGNIFITSAFGITNTTGYLYANFAVAGASGGSHVLNSAVSGYDTANKAAAGVASIASMVTRSGTAYLYNDGALVVSDADSSTYASKTQQGIGLGVGFNQTSANGYAAFQGDLYSAMIISRAITDAERFAIEAYMLAQAGM